MTSGGPTQIEKSASRSAGRYSHSTWAWVGRTGPPPCGLGPSDAGHMWKSTIFEANNPPPPEAGGDGGGGDGGGGDGGVTPGAGAGVGSLTSSPSRARP